MNPLNFKTAILKNTRIILIVLILIVLVNMDISAQCAMCRMSAESNLEHGGSSGKGLNLGILYMLVIPYLSVSILAYILYRKRMAKKEVNTGS